MPSRVERYYRNSTEVKERTKRNEDLYRQIYETGEYSNIEGIASIGNANEIDITKIKEMLKNREDYNKEKQYRQVIKKEREIEIPVIEEKEEERNYDIRDILNKAKVERTDDNKQRSLRNTQYNILKNLQVKEEKEFSKFPDVDREDEELKELINTITSTSMLNKLNDEDFSLEMFSDLKGTGNTFVDDNRKLESILKEQEESRKVEDDEKIELDKSFYTSNVNLKEEDFYDFNDEKEKKPWGLYIFLIILTIIFIVGGLYMLSLA